MTDITLHFSLKLSLWQAHQFDVRLLIPAHNTSSLTLSLPSWIPGSYMVRDFAKNIISLTAKKTSANTLAAEPFTQSSVNIEKLDKQTWSVQTDGDACIIDYTIYANDLSIRSAFINHEYAFINGTSAFLHVEEFANTTHKLDITLDDNIPFNWNAYTSMEPRERCSANGKSDVLVTSMLASEGNEKVNGNNRAWYFEAKNYDEFIDHPIYVGVADTYEFEIDNVNFTLLFSGNNTIDYARIAKDLIPICQHHLSLFGTPYPIKNYLFMTLLADNGFGGLEHKYSTALLYPRFELPFVGDGEEMTDGYITFLSLCSHEFFHTWHVKRIKPNVMVKPDLSKENYTNQLWIYEGFTSFYDDLALARAGTIPPQKYLDIVAQNISRLLQNAGRFKQSAAESSFDAWTKFYKQDASATNNIVSYYTKGGIIALGLDLLLREQSGDTVCLDDVMRILWQQYGKDESGTPDNVIQMLCKEHFSIDVSDYLNSVVYHTEDVELEALVQQIGIALHTRAKVSSEDTGGLSLKAPIKRQLGATLKAAPVGLTVVQVFEGLAAMRAGILLNDNIIAIDGHVVAQGKLQRILDTTFESTAEVSLIRDGQLLNVTLPIMDARKDMAFFEINDADAFSHWLGVN